MPVEPASRLAFEVKRRRDQLARTQLEVHAAGGPSNTTQTAIENAAILKLAPSTAKKLDRGLAWEPGSAMRVWRGEGDPVPVGAAEQDAGYVASPGERKPSGVTNDEVLRELRAMQRRIEELSQRMENGGQ